MLSVKNHEVKLRNLFIGSLVHRFISKKVYEEFVYLLASFAKKQINKLPTDNSLIGCSINSVENQWTIEPMN